MVFVMIFFGDKQYELAILGSTETVKIDALREWHALRVTCCRCNHVGYVSPLSLQRMYPRYVRIIDTEHRFRCRACKVRGAITWFIVKQRR